METHGSRKWDPPPPEEAFLIPGKGDSIFINPFFLWSEISSGKKKEKETYLKGISMTKEVGDEMENGPERLHARHGIWCEEH